MWEIMRQTLKNKVLQSCQLVAYALRAIAYSANGAIAITDSYAVITKGSAAAMTLAAPAATQNGHVMTITSSTGYAHTVTCPATTLYNGTTGAKTTMTFPAFVGATITLVAYDSNWHVLATPSAGAVVVS